jgi:hypothetical protein
MHSKYSDRAVSLLGFLPLLFLPTVLTGQRLQESVVPLKNWAAPLYWQPNQAETAGMAERETAVGLTPKLVFSATQVSPSALTFVAVTPCRLVDTRGSAAGFNGVPPFSGPSIAPSTTVTFPVQLTTAPAPCGTIPSIAQAYSFNVTVIPKTAGGIAFVSLWPSGGTEPAVSTLNDGQGEILANAAIVPAGTPDGGVNFFNSGPATMDVIIDMNGFYAAPTDLNANTAIGTGALVSNSTGAQNTASGYDALQDNTSGQSNTANGSLALQHNINGNDNTASGTGALAANISGTNNTAIGVDALVLNTTGGNNTAIGGSVLVNNTMGNQNSAFGQGALQSNNTGSQNTALGVFALNGNTTGNLNTAVGYEASGGGSNNTSIGVFAGGGLSGGNNIAIGASAGISAGQGNNIDIGSPGAMFDYGAIRIGTPDTQTSFFVAGVSNTNLGSDSNAVGVLIDTTTGQLGVMSSSRRYKEDIEDMGEASHDLMRLRPVTFRYKKAFADGSKPIQYGLIAEEVDDVYPDLVAHSTDGQIETVKYQVLDSMLLNEVQRQQAEIRRLEERLAKLEAALASMSPASGIPGGR